MDELLQKLHRKYSVSGDPVSGLQYITTLLRSGYFTPFIQEHIQSEMGEPPPHEIFYGAWSPTDNAILLVTVVRKFREELDYPPPSPKLPEHMSSSESHAYDVAWQDYYSQDRGDLIVFCHYFFPDEPEGRYEHRRFNVLRTAAPIKRWIDTQLQNLAAAQQEAEQPISEWLPFLDKLNDYDFTEELEPLQEEPKIRTEFGDRCEDFPACGHEPGRCPRYFEDGTQAEMICVCGASLPANSRFSICDACLNRPDPDDPYGHYPDYDDYYDDYDDIEDY